MLLTEAWAAWWCPQPAPLDPPPSTSDRDVGSPVLRRRAVESHPGLHSAQVPTYQDTLVTTGCHRPGPCVRFRGRNGEVCLKRGRSGPFLDELIWRRLPGRRANAHL